MKRLFFLLFVLTLTIVCAALAESAPQMAPPRPLETPPATAAPEATATAEITTVAETTATPEATATPAPQDIFSLLPAQMPTVPPQPTRDPGRLTGVKIGIDPGHQAHGNSAQEAVAPGSPRRRPRFPPAPMAASPACRNTKSIWTSPCNCATLWKRWAARST